MDSETESVKSHTESEEDDVGCYFLQPSSAPYNITEKVQQANVDLFNSQHKILEKMAKVKFREELISFEPDLTDNDVNSIESDHTESSTNNESPVLEFKTPSNEDNVNVLNLDDVDEEPEEVFEEEEVESETETEYKPEVKINTVTEKLQTCELNVMSNVKSGREKKLSKSRLAFLNPHEVNCKDHCIDKLDYNLSVSLKRLDINEKIDLPPLQLIERKCCNEVKKKVPQNLPHYTGLRSEYGLSSRQLEKREKQKQLLKIRERMRQQIIEEYRRRKIQQNEEVFCQWLKEVSKRKSEKKTKRRVTSAKSNINLNKTLEKVKERPKTADAFVPKTKPRKKRRPQNSARVYIEIPSSCLEKQLRIGNLTIRNSKLLSKNIHIIAVS